MSQEDDFLTMNLPENFRPAKLFTGKYRPLVGIFAIFAGILILTSNLNSILSAFTPDWLYNVLDYAIRLTPRLLIGILIIVFGIRLVRGKKEEIFDEEIFEDEK